MENYKTGACVFRQNKKYNTEKSEINNHVAYDKVEFKKQQGRNRKT